MNATPAIRLRCVRIREVFWKAGLLASINRKVVPDRHIRTVTAMSLNLSREK